MRLLAILVLALGIHATAAAEAPSRRPLKWSAPRGNAGRQPPKGGEWQAFNGQVPASHLVANPGHDVAAPLAGVRPASHLRVNSADGLVQHGVLAPIARRAGHHALTGLPSAASHASSDDFLVARRDMVLSYSSSRRTPNWVSWRTTKEDLGDSGRSDFSWRADPSLPANFSITTFHDYQNAGYDPGHLVPSADRTRSRRNNMRTYLTSNTVPQSFNNNRGPWAKLENYARDHVRWGEMDAHVLAGPVFGSAPLKIGNGVPVPNATWKIVVLLPRGKGLETVDATTPMVSVLIPNNDRDVALGDSFHKYVVSPAEIEQKTGLKFFTALPQPIADALRARKDVGPPPPKPPQQQRAQN